MQRKIFALAIGTAVVACGLDVVGTAAPPSPVIDAGPAPTSSLPPPSIQDDSGADGGDAGACVDIDTNPLHCGACGHSCLGAQCVDSVCVPEVLMTGLKGAFSVVVGATNVFVAENAGGNIYRYDPDAGVDAGFRDLIYATKAAPRALALHGGRLYWVDQAHVQSIQNDGGGSNQQQGISNGSAVVADMNGVAYNDINGQRISISTLDLSPQKSPGQNQPNTVGIDLTATEVFWTDSTDAGEIRRALRTDDNQSSVLVANEVRPESIVVGPARVFWTTPTAIRTANLDGGGDASTLFENESLPRALAHDGTHLYWFNVAQSTLRRGNLDGTGEISLAREEFQQAELPLTTAIAFDDQYVYWVTSIDNGELKRVAK